MRSQFEYSGHPIYPAAPRTWRVFIRADDLDAESVRTLNTLPEYRVCPALHMNLGTADLPDRAYIDSGYVSAFEFHDNSALKAANAYLAYKNVHFIFIPEALCDSIYLTGGTRGFEKNGKTTHPRREEGSSWQIPVRNAVIPQIFNTDNMSVALMEGDSRSSCEVLIGGNWKDYAVCFTLPKSLSREIAGYEPQDIATLERLLRRSGSLPYLLNPDRSISYAQREAIATQAKQLQTWWKTLGEERKLLCFMHAVLEGNAYREPNPEKEPRFMRDLWAVQLRLNEMMSRTPSARHYLNALQLVITRLHGQLLPFHPSYHPLFNRFVQEFKEAVHQQNEEEMQQRIHYLHTVDKALQAEEQFLKRLRQSHHQQFLPSTALQTHLEQCCSLQSMVSPTSNEKELIEKTMYVKSVTEALEKELTFFKHHQITRQLMNLEQFRAGREHSFIFHLVEWYNVWVDKSDGLFKSLSPEALHQQAKTCAKTQTALIKLQQLFDQCNARGAGINQEKSNHLFRQLVARVTNQLEQALRAGTSLDVGRYIDEATHYLLILLAQRLGSQRNAFFNEKMQSNHLQNLDRIPKPRAEETKPVLMGTSLSFH
ncbi:hypothetical protein [Legionella taurinensis]|nr:hypothetical protein [Legionella taurinensis]MDX1835964.1 hypothetical protein [Legionella taurinensis]STY24910.1 Uncharacterised protein [Legionella taurinensis]